MRKGQKVSWRTSRGKATGTIIERHTEDLEFKGQIFRANAYDPVYVVESSDTGATAAHHEDALRETS